MLVFRAEGYRRTSALFMSDDEKGRFEAAVTAMQLLDDPDPKNPWGYHMEYIPGMEVVEYELVERARVPAKEFFERHGLNPQIVLRKL